MKTKLIVLLALMLCMGAFMLPTMAYASQSGSPPTVTAEVRGETLRIEASSGFLGIEAIFINGQRFNFRVDGVLSVDLLGLRYSEEISVYAVDFAGHISNVVSITNPHYVGLNIPIYIPQEIPVASLNPFTPAGQASVLDNATSHDDKEFFTFTTYAGNVFFLVIDRQRGSDNVYFLNAVTEQDLIALAERAGNEIVVGGGIPVTTTPQIPVEQPEIPPIEQVDPPPAPAESGGGNGTMIFILVALAIAGGVGYYLKIVRPKQQEGNGDYDDENEDDEDMGEEMEFETEYDEANYADMDESYTDTNEDYGDDDEPTVEDDGL